MRTAPYLCKYLYIICLISTYSLSALELNMGDIKIKIKNNEKGVKFQVLLPIIRRL